jgi:hypothetical protein
VGAFEGNAFCTQCALPPRVAHLLGIGAILACIRLDLRNKPSGHPSRHRTDARKTDEHQVNSDEPTSAGHRGSP